jgi:hypothetical protein
MSEREMSDLPEDLVLDEVSAERISGGAGPKPAHHHWSVRQARKHGYNPIGCTPGGGYLCVNPKTGKEIIIPSVMAS